MTMTPGQDVEMLLTNIFSRKTKTAISLLEQGKINVESIITNHIRIEEIPQMFEKLANPPHDELKVLVDFE